MAGRTKPDLSMFDAANKAKIPWDQRVKLIKKVFPSTEQLDWKKLFDEDRGLIGEIVNDIIKAAQASPGRPGKRAAVEVDVARRELVTLLGEDYTTVTFPDSLRDLMGGRSIRQTANRTGLDRNVIHRILQGRLHPDIWTIEQIAQGFKKDPSFFPEYRDGWILAAVWGRLQKNEESSILYYRKLRGVGKWGM